LQITVPAVKLLTCIRNVIGYTLEGTGGIPVLNAIIRGVSLP